MLDATCAPSNIRYPQDYSLLNEAREKLENIIDRFSKSYGFKKPRTYRREARKNYLALAKCKKQHQRRSVKPYASNWVMLTETLAICVNGNAGVMPQHRKK